MLFSIVIPVYNVEKYVAECIESIIGQSYENWELILVDDGSTDASAAVCSQYAQKDGRIRLYQKTNSGQADSRNLGVEKAVGDWLIFVDSDDYIADSTLQTILDEILKWDKLDVIITDGEYQVFENRIDDYRCRKCEDYMGLSGRETILKTMSIGPNWSPCGKAYRLRYWREHGFVFLTNRLAEDFELIDRVVLEAECVSMIPSFYYYRRFREGSTVTKINKKLQHDVLLNFFEWEEYFKKKNLDQELVSSFRRLFSYLYCHDVLAYLYLFKGEEYKELRGRARHLLFYLDYSDQKDIQLVRKGIKILGMDITCFLLGMIKRKRLKRERKTRMDSR